MFHNYQDINKNLENLKTNYLFTERKVCSDEQAKKNLVFYEEFDSFISEYKKENISLAELYSVKNHPLDDYFILKEMVEILYTENCEGLFKKITLELKSMVSKHVETQKIVEEEVETSRYPFSGLSCHCNECLGTFRAKIRNYLVEEWRAHKDGFPELIKEWVSSQNLEGLENFYYKEKTYIEKIIFKQRNKLRKASLNKLRKQLLTELKEELAYPSEIAKIYFEDLRPKLIVAAEEKNLHPEVLEEEHFDKFLSQLEHRMFRPQRFIRKQFYTLLRSVLTFKRKDVSSTILQDYLGRFWEHSYVRDIKRKIVYHAGPTNSGKTYHAVNALCAVEKGTYLAPLRLLAAELYDTMNGKGVKTSLLTGEEVVDVDGAKHFSSTVEMAKLDVPFDLAVIDEIQMITDPQRGWAWTRALVNLDAPEIHVCGDPSAIDLVKQIAELTGDDFEIKTYERMTKLKVMDGPVTISELERGDALIVFSRRNALKFKSDLERLNFKVSIVYGRLSPEVRKEQARKFDEGETDIIVATDAISMGMNLPIKRIIFSTFSKFIMSREYVITPSEIKQIAGRAGRYGRFPVGYATTLVVEHERYDLLEDALTQEIPQKTRAMVGPDLNIYTMVNQALEKNELPTLTFTEFLRLFNTMVFSPPFYCVKLNEMIEVAEMVEDANSENQSLKESEVFGFACAPVNLGLETHVHYFQTVLRKFAAGITNFYPKIDPSNDDIDYLETSIKVVELFQWLSRHFRNKHFDFSETELTINKSLAVEKLNKILSEKIVRKCPSCGVKLADGHKFNICEGCFEKRAFGRKKKRGGFSSRGKGEKKFRRTGSSDRSKGGVRKKKKFAPRKPRS